MLSLSAASSSALPTILEGWRREREGTWPGLTVVFPALAFADARLALSGSDDRTVKLWSVNDSNCIRTLHSHTASALRRRPPPPPPCSAYILFPLLTPFLLLGAVWGSEITSVAFHPSGTCVAVCGSAFFPWRDRLLRLPPCFPSHSSAPFVVT